MKINIFLKYFIIYFNSKTKNIDKFKSNKVFHFVLLRISIINALNHIQFRRRILSVSENYIEIFPIKYFIVLR